MLIITQQTDKEKDESTSFGAEATSPGWRTRHIATLLRCFLPIKVMGNPAVMCMFKEVEVRHFPKNGSGTYHETAFVNLGSSTPHQLKDVSCTCLHE